METHACYLTYKGYCLECQDEGGLLHGRIAGIRDMVTFHGQSPQELQQAFEEAVDDYLAVCGEACLAPDTARA